MKILGYAFIGFIIAWFSYMIGTTPSDQEIYINNQTQQATNDLTLVSTKYNQLYNLCEQKYQYGIDGDLQTAYILKGQMEAIQIEIDTILARYNAQGL